MAVIRRHSDRQAALPRRKKRSIRRLNFVLAKTGSIIPCRAPATFCCDMFRTLPELRVVAGRRQMRADERDARTFIDPCRDATFHMSIRRSGGVSSTAPPRGSSGRVRWAGSRGGSCGSSTLSCCGSAEGGSVWVYCSRRRCWRPEARELGGRDVMGSSTSMTVSG